MPATRPAAPSPQVGRATVRIEWYEASAESTPLPAEAFDAALCQLGLQFMSDKLAALQEMRRVLVHGSRIVLSVPGPAGPVFAVLAEAMERHIGSEAARFVHRVFSLNDTAELQRLTSEAGFRDVAVGMSHQDTRRDRPLVGHRELRQAVDWLAGIELFGRLRFRRDSTWQPQTLAITTLLRPES